MIDAHFIQRLDWHRTVGLQLGMINSQEPPGRNQFYDRMLGKHVRHRRCIDIGFGTGLLTMLAIKHGAEHVEAWEKDRDVFELGLRLIHHLHLDHRISLHHGRFNAASLEDRDRVVFHEIIGNRIWNEGLRHALPLNADVCLPPEVVCEFDAVRVSRERVREVFFPPRLFDPGVETVPDFDRTLQSIIDATPDRSLKYRDVLHRLAPLTDTQRWPFYHINFAMPRINGREIDSIPDSHLQQYEIKLENDEAMVLWPRITLMHAGDRLHWGWYDPIIIDQTGVYEIEQDFDDGMFSFYL